MRDYPWLERPVSWLHVQTLSGLLQRLELGRAWQRHLGGGLQGGPGRRLERVPEAATANEFKSWCETEIGALTPEEGLAQLSRDIRVFEQSVIGRVLDRPEDAPELARIARRQGAAAAAALRSQTAVGNGSLSSHALCLEQSALGWLEAPSEASLFVVRELPDRIEWLRGNCPHRDPLLKKAPLADALCAGHRDWLLGYSAELLPQATLVFPLSHSPVSVCRAVLALKHGGH